MHPPFLARHEGLLGLAEVERLGKSTVAIAGVGGIGGRVAEVLARSGIGSLRVADPDTFTVSNLNRQAASTLHNLGVNKAVAVAEMCRAVSPLVSVDIWQSGVTSENVDDFVAGATVLVDGTDYTRPSIGLRLARSAAARGIPVVIGVEVAFAAWHTALFGAGAFERLFGLARDTSYDVLDAGDVAIPLWRWIAQLPRYVDVAEIQRVAAGTIEAPALATAVELSAAMLSADVIRILLGRSVVARAPSIHYGDVVTGKSCVFRPTALRFNLSALRARYSRDSLRATPLDGRG